MVKAKRDKKIVIGPVTRIEGHAQVTIFLNNDDSVKEARFQVTDFRGFEKFTEGRPFYEMPSYNFTMPAVSAQSATCLLQPKPATPSSELTRQKQL